MKSNNEITILVVDDQDSIRNSITQLLQDEGYHSLSFALGEDALNYLQEHTIDLLLLDIMMPGKSGLEILKILREEYSQLDLPVILITAFAGYIV